MLHEGAISHRAFLLVLVAFLIAVAVALLGSQSTSADVPVSSDCVDDLWSPHPLSIVRTIKGESISDTYIAVDSRETHADAPELLTDNASTRRPLYHIDVGSVISGPAEIESAVLTLTVLRPHGNDRHLDVCVHEIVRHWVPTETTWYLASGSSEWYMPGCDSTQPLWVADRAETPVDCQRLCTETLQGGIGTVEFDLTGLVQKWLDEPNSNHGVILLGQADWAVTWRIASSEHAVDSRRPLMEVMWLAVSPTPTLTPTHTSSPAPTVTPALTVSPMPSPTLVRTLVPVYVPLIMRDRIESPWTVVY